MRTRNVCRQEMLRGNLSANVVRIRQFVSKYGEDQGQFVSKCGEDQGQLVSKCGEDRGQIH